ncbi:uncharacterized protein FIBRA_01540 [Fibroporia radiculosa]|uniref:Cytochrome P450 n=1 Tax=Fibroporia radiculosa TaxID=599839 RepID=J4HTH8_9APHY|nr:uncharacterized protein FIBRA_01540 [Fibroporia radiculosa]CCL99522.1 predicted protein [Fibroporia radiculosa]
MSCDPMSLGLFIALGLWGFWRYLSRQKIDHALNKIPGPPPQSFLFGNLLQFFHPRGSGFHRRVALDYGLVSKMYGMFKRPILYVSDPRALHTIVAKEEHIFEKADWFLTLNTLLFGPGLLSVSGNQHRKQRRMLNPVFSVNHLRRMMPIFYQVGHELRDALAGRVYQDPTELDVLDWCGRAAVEIIGRAGLGHSFRSLTDDTDSAYEHAMKSLIPNIQKLYVWRRLLPFLVKTLPSWLRARLVNLVPSRSAANLKSIAILMADKSLEIYNQKKRALDKGDQAVVHQMEENDVMSVLMKANAAAPDKERLTDEELLGQMSTLIFAAMDTTSNIMAHILQLLAERPDIQANLRDEIVSAQAGDSIPYDELNTLPLLDGVCKETLRLYPPVAMVTRVAREDTVLPLSAPIIGTNGSEMYEIPIPKGTDVIIGCLGSNIQHDFWGQDSLEWKPERWLSPLPETVTDASIPGVYSNLMTFIGGKRGCIGFKFAELEIKMVLAILLTTFTFEPTHQPIEWNVASIWFPTVGNERSSPRLPLKVGLVERSESQILGRRRTLNL